jgi:hypothetical protein
MKYLAFCITAIILTMASHTSIAGKIATTGPNERAKTIRMAYLHEDNPATNASDYDSAQLAFIDELVVYAVLPNPNTGEIDKLFTTEKGAANQLGISRELLEQLQRDTTKYGVKLSLGVGGLVGVKEIKNAFNTLVDKEHLHHFSRQLLTLCNRYNIRGIDLAYWHVGNKGDGDKLAILATALNEVLTPAGISLSATFSTNLKATANFLRQHHHLFERISVRRYAVNPKVLKKTLSDAVALGIPKSKLFGSLALFARPADKKVKHSLAFNRITNLDDATKAVSFMEKPFGNKEAPVIRYNCFCDDKSLRAKVTLIQQQGYGGIAITGLLHDLSPSHAQARLPLISRYAEMHE